MVFDQGPPTSLSVLECARRSATRTSRHLFTWLLGAALIVSLGLNVAILTSFKVFDRSHALLESIAEISVLKSAASAFSSTPLLGNSSRRHLQRLADANSLAEIEQLKRDKQKLATATMALVAEYESLAIRHAILDTKLSELSARHQLLARKAERQRVVAARVSKSVANRLVNASTRNLASFAGRAAPIVGTAVAVGTMYMDMKDACNTLRDINELSAEIGEGMLSSMVCGTMNAEQPKSHPQAN